jgi:hypothetical protein
MTIGGPVLGGSSVMNANPPSPEMLDGLLRKKCGTSLDELIRSADLDESETLFWSGSWVDGFANSRSDLDLYLIGSIDSRPGGEVEVTGPGMPSMYMSVTPGTVRVDLTVVPPQLMTALAGYLGEFDSDTDYPTVWSDNFREFVHRLSIGVPVANEKRFHEYRDSVDFAKFRQYLLRFYHNRADSLFEDVLGLVDEGDPVSAYFVARQRLEAAMDMFLVANGETNTRVDKWRWKKLSRISAGGGARGDIVPRFLSCEGLDRQGAGDAAAMTQACLELADDLILRAI